MAKASDILRVADPDARVREAKAWLKSKGVRDFEPVSLFCDQLTKVRTPYFATSFAV
jgi:5'-3' exoribonuclease 1